MVVERRDEDTQCFSEELLQLSDEKNLTLSMYEALKFRNILRGLDKLKKIPVHTQRAIEHIDLTQALKRTAFV